MSYSLLMTIKQARKLYRAEKPRGLTGGKSFRQWARWHIQSGDARGKLLRILSRGKS